MHTNILKYDPLTDRWKYKCCDFQIIDELKIYIYNYKNELKYVTRTFSHSLKKDLDQAVWVYSDGNLYMNYLNKHGQFKTPIRSNQ